MKMEDNSEDRYSIFVAGLLSFIPVIIIVYSHFFFKELLLHKRKYLLYIISLIIVTIIGMGIFVFLQYFYSFGNNDLFQHFINTSFVIIFSTGLQYLKRGIIGQYQIQELAAKKTEIELNALKAQLNPHFLFNTLNNIYSINRIDSNIGSEMILELSDVMRYHLDSSQKDWISMDQELKLIHAFIILEKLRLNDICTLKININLVDHQIKIAPLIFLPFIENAFKHGTHSTQKCFITLNLESEGSKIKFDIENSIFSNKQIVKTNIGLENTIRRLELIYPKKHELIMKSEDNKYRVTLIIDSSS